MHPERASLGADRVGKVLLGVLAAAAAVWLLRAGALVLAPLALALLIALAVFPVVEALGRRRVPFWASVALGVVTVLGLLGGLVFLVQLGLTDLVERLPQYEEPLQRLWRGLTSRLGLRGEEVPEMANDVLRALAGLAAAAAAGLATVGAQLVIVFFYVLFLLFTRRHLADGLRRAFGERRATRALEVLRDVERQMLRFVALRTFLSLLTASGILVLLKAYGVESAFLWAAIMFAAQYVPYLGPIVGSALPVAMALVQFPSPWTAAALAGWIVAWNTLLGNFVEPRVMGRGLMLSEFLVLFGIAFFAWMWGLVGALVAVPMLVVVRRLCRQFPRSAPWAVLMEPASRHARALATEER